MDSLTPLTEKPELSAEELDPDHLKIITVLNPLKSQELEVTWVKFEKGRSLADYLSASQELVVSVSGGIVEKSEWDLYFPSINDTIVIAPVMEGDNGKDILRVVAFIVLAVVTYGASTGYFATAGGLFAAGSASAAFLAAGITIAGTALINAALPVQQATAGTKNNLSESASYGIDGPVNVSKEGIVVPVVYGTHRCGGNIINLYTENMNRTQILYMLIAVSEGPVASIYDLLINDQPISAFNLVVTDFRNGDHDQDTIPWFEETVVMQAAGDPILSSWVAAGEHSLSRITTQVVDRLRIDLIAPGGFFEVNDDGALKSLSKQIAIGYRQVESDGGPLGGGAHEPISYEVGQHLFETFGQRYRYINMFDVSQEDGNLNDAFQGQWIYRDTLRAGDVIDADGVIRSSTGNIVGYDAAEPIYSLTEFGDPVFEGRSRYPVRESWFTPRLTEGYYEIFVGRVDPVDPSDRVQDEIKWTLWGEIITDPVAYQNTALVGLKVRLTDQINGIPKITYMCDGIQCRVFDVPSQLWVYTHTRNPAYIAMDMLMNTRYGMGVGWDEIDREAFKAWAAFCDAQTNPLYFDGVFDQSLDSWSALQYVFRAGHASINRNGTKYSVVTEAESEPVQMFAAGNIVEKTINESWITMDERANAVDVTYFEENERYARRTLRVVDDTVPAGIEEKPAAITMIGVTNRDRAAEEGYFHLNLNRLITKTISFESSIEAIACVPGSTFMFKGLQNEAIYSGRVVSSIASDITVDRDVLFETGFAYLFVTHHDAYNFNNDQASHRVKTGSINVPAGTFTVEGSWIGVGTNSDPTIRNPDPANASHISFHLGGIGNEVKSIPIEGLVVTVKSGSFNNIYNEIDISVDPNDPILTQISNLDPVNLYEQDGVYEMDVNEFPVETNLVEFFVTHGNSHSVQNWKNRVPFLLVKKTETIKEYRVVSIEPGSDEYKRKITGLEYNPLVYDYTSGIIPPATPINDPITTAIGQVTNLQITEQKTYVQGQVVFTIFVNWDVPTTGVYEGAAVFGRFNNDPVFEQVITTEGGITLYSFDSILGLIFTLRVVARDIDGERAPFSAAPEASWITGQSEVTELETTSLIGEGLFLRNRISWQVNSQISYHHASLFFTYDVGGNPVDDIGQATEIKDVPGFEFNHDNLSEGTYRYWVVAYDLTGEVAPTYPSGSGVLVTPLGNIEALFDALGFLLSESHLDTLLRSRIDKIPTLVDLTEFQSLLDQITSLVALENTNNTLIITETATRESENQSSATAVTGLGARMDTAEAAIVAEQIARANADSAEASARLALTAQIDVNTADITTARADILAEQIARAAGDSAEAVSRETLAVALTGQTSPTSDPNDLVASSLIYNERAVRVSAEGAIASDVTQLQATSATHTGQISTINVVTIPSVEAGISQIAALQGNTALVSSVTQLVLDVGVNSTAIEQRLEITEFQAEYSMRIDANGYIAGFGLGVESLPGSGPTSSFIIRADKFFIADAGYEPGGQPIFSVITSPQTDPTSGVTVPAGIYLNGDVYASQGIDTHNLAQSSVVVPYFYFGSTSNYTAGQNAPVGVSFTQTKQNAVYYADLSCSVTATGVPSNQIGYTQASFNGASLFNAGFAPVVGTNTRSGSGQLRTNALRTHTGASGAAMDFLTNVTMSNWSIPGAADSVIDFSATWTLIIVEFQK